MRASEHGLALEFSLGVKRVSGALSDERCFMEGDFRANVQSRFIARFSCALIKPYRKIIQSCQRAFMSFWIELQAVALQTKHCATYICADTIKETSSYQTQTQLQPLRCCCCFITSCHVCNLHRLQYQLVQSIARTSPIPGRKSSRYGRLLCYFACASNGYKAWLCFLTTTDIINPWNEMAG